jgi:hypothetical protein
MIEIRADRTAPPASEDGPQSPEQTVAIADGIWEAAVLLHRATRPGRGGLRHPVDVDKALGAWSAAVDTLPQTLDHLHDFVTEATRDLAAQREQLHGVVDDDAQGAASLAESMREAADHARALARVLRTAKFAMRSMPSIRDDLYTEDELLDIDDEAPEA